MRAHHFVVYEEVNLMAFPSEEEQLRKFRNDEVAQHYFEVLRTLISKKSIFAQNIGLYDVAAYLGEIFSRVGAEVTVDETYAAPFVLGQRRINAACAKTVWYGNQQQHPVIRGDGEAGQGHCGQRHGNCSDFARAEFQRHTVREQRRDDGKHGNHRGNAARPRYRHVQILAHGGPCRPDRKSVV